MITASREDAIDYEETARVATEAFGSRDTTFYPAQIRWCRNFGTRPLRGRVASRAADIAKIFARAGAAADGRAERT